MISVARLPIQDGVGTVGYTIYGSDLNEISARSILSVVRLFEGSDWALYGVVVEMPEQESEMVVVWDDGSGNATIDRLFLNTTITIEVPR